MSKPTMSKPITKGRYVALIAESDPQRIAWIAKDEALSWVNQGYGKYATQHDIATKRSW